MDPLEKNSALFSFWLTELVERLVAQLTERMFRVLAFLVEKGLKSWNETVNRNELVSSRGKQKMD